MAGAAGGEQHSDPTLKEGCPGFPQDRAGCGHAGICLQPARTGYIDGQDITERAVMPGSAFNLQELPGSVLVACPEGER